VAVLKIQASVKVF